MSVYPESTEPPGRLTRRRAPVEADALAFMIKRLGGGVFGRPRIMS